MWSQFWEMLPRTRPLIIINLILCYTEFVHVCASLLSQWASVFPCATLCMGWAASVHSSSHLRVITLSTLIEFSYWAIMLEKTFISCIPPRATFQREVFIYSATSFPLYSVSSFAGKLSIIPTSLRSRATRSVASPAMCWRCKISARPTACTYADTCTKKKKRRLVHFGKGNVNSQT